MSLKIKKLKELILEDFELSLDIALIIFFVFTLIYLGIRGSSLGIIEWVIICAIFAILLLISFAYTIYDLYKDIVSGKLFGR